MQKKTHHRGDEKMKQKNVDIKGKTKNSHSVDCKGRGVTMNHRAKLISFSFFFFILHHLISLQRRKGKKIIVSRCKKNEKKPTNTKKKKIKYMIRDDESDHFILQIYGERFCYFCLLLLYLIENEMEMTEGEPTVVVCHEENVGRKK